MARSMHPIIITPPLYKPTASNPPDFVRIAPAMGGPPAEPKAWKIKYKVMDSRR